MSRLRTWATLGVGLTALFGRPARAADGEATVTFTRLLVRDQDGVLLGGAGEALRVVILEEMRKAGLAVRGAENVLFDQDHSNEARFHLGGTVTEVHCTHERLPACEIAVEWQLFDPSSASVVYTAVTRGMQHSTDTTTANAGVWALRAAVRSLAGRPRLHTALIAPAGGTGGLDIGGTPSADLTVRIPSLTDAELQDRISNGFNTAMPPQYTDPQDIADVIAYLRLTFPRFSASLRSPPEALRIPGRPGHLLHRHEGGLLRRSERAYEPFGHCAQLAPTGPGGAANPPHAARSPRAPLPTAPVGPCPTGASTRAALPPRRSPSSHLERGGAPCGARAGERRCPGGNS